MNIIITGATRGLGLSHALYLSKKGHNLAIIDISRSACQTYGDVNNIDELLSDLSSGVTGENLHVDAGYNVVGMKAEDAPDIDVVSKRGMER